MNSVDKKLLREMILSKRKEVSLVQQAHCSEVLGKVVSALSIFTKSQHIAAYWPHQGEISPLPLLKLAFSLQKKCYLPIVQNDLLSFIEYQENDPLIKGAYGVLEPLHSKQAFAAENLDLVLLPLLAFDEKGRRLGYGKGFYDKTFAFLKDHSKLKPYLLGLAYHWQQVQSLPFDPWDIALNGIATENEVWKT